MDFDFFSTSDSSGPRNQFDRTASEEAGKIAEFEQDAYETVRRCNGEKDAVMTHYKANQAMRSLVDPNDSVLKEAYAARSRILKAELLRLGVDESWFTEWESLD